MWCNHVWFGQDVSLAFLVGDGRKVVVRVEMAYRSLVRAEGRNRGIINQGSQSLITIWTKNLMSY